jgi:hypothetical protein
MKSVSTSIRPGTPESSTSAHVYAPSTPAILSAGVTSTASTVACPKGLRTSPTWAVPVAARSSV